MSIFLATEDLRILTGHARKAHQIAYLEKDGIAFILNACGQPVVRVADVCGYTEEEPVKATDRIMDPFNGIAPLTWTHQNMHRFMIKRDKIVDDSVLYSVDSDIDVPGVYFLIKDNEIMYVGISYSIQARLLQHKKSGKIFDRISHIEIPVLVMESVESVYIHALNPPWNNSMPILYDKFQQYVDAYMATERGEVQ